MLIRLEPELDNELEMFRNQKADASRIPPGGELLHRKFFAFSPGLRRALASTTFSLTARFRTAVSLRFICLAIVAALAPDKASARRRSSSCGVQTGPAGVIFPSPSALARLVARFN
jgi:hypothetical protein